MAGSKSAPPDWKDPQWHEAGKVHDWKNYAGEWLREMWHSFYDEQKKAVAASLDDVASAEEWD